MQNYDNKLEQTEHSTFSPTKNYLRFDKLQQTLHGLDKIIQESKSKIHNPYQHTNIQSGYDSHLNRTTPSANKQKHTQIDIKILSNYGSNKKTIRIERPDNTTVNLRINGQVIGPIHDYTDVSQYRSHHKSQRYDQQQYKPAPQSLEYFLKNREQNKQKNTVTTKSFTSPYMQNQTSSPYVRDYHQYPNPPHFQQKQQQDIPTYPILNNSKHIKKDLLESSHLKGSNSSRKNRERINIDRNTYNNEQNYFSIQHKETSNGGNILTIQQNYPGKNYYSSEVNIKESINYQNQQDQIVQEKKFDVNIRGYEDSQNLKNSQQRKWNSRPVSHTSSQRGDIKINNETTQNIQSRQPYVQEHFKINKQDQHQDHEQQQNQQKQYRYSEILKPVDQPLRYGNQNIDKNINMTTVEKTSNLMRKYRHLDKCKKTYSKKQRDNSYQSNKSMSPKCREITQRLTKSKSKIPCPRFVRQLHHDKLNQFRKKIKENYGFIQTYISQSDLDKIYKEMIQQNIPQHKWPQKAVDFVYNKVKTVYSH